MSARADLEGVAASELGQAGEARVETPRGAHYLPGVFPGERVRVRVEPGKRGSARLLEVLDPSPHRREPPCALAVTCGGCGLIALEEAEAGRAKQAMLARAFGEAREISWYASPRSLGYRRRARLRFDAARGLLGYRGKRSRALVSVSSCPVLTGALDACLPLIREALPALAGRGEIALADTLDGASIVVVAECTQPPGAYAALEALSRRVGVASVALRVPGSPVLSVFGARTERHVGPDGLPLITPLGGFVQANAEINAQLAELVERWAEPAGARVVELFSGSGNLSVRLARGALTAVEGHEEAAALAETNLSARGLSARVVAEDAERARLPRADVLVLDPPRRGFPGLARALEEVRPTRVVLVACDLGSLSRELGTLRRAGFEVTDAAGFDMFPQTQHLEALVRLRAT